MVAIAAAAALITVGWDQSVGNGRSGHGLAIHVARPDEIDTVRRTRLRVGIGLDITTVVVAVIAALDEPPVIPYARFVFRQTSVYPFSNGFDDLSDKIRDPTHSHISLANHGRENQTYIS